MDIKLYAYQINSQTLGLEIFSWTADDIGNNEPFLILKNDDIAPVGYVDISNTIQNWYNYAPNTNLAQMQIIDVTNLIGYNNLGDADKAIVDSIGFYYNIYRYVYDSSKYDLQVVPFDLPYSIDEAPYNLDYDVVGLHKKQTFVKGELLKVQYYGDYNPNTSTYSNICVEEMRTYNRSNNFLRSRDMIISWFKSDGTVGATKVTKKYYNTFDAIVSGNQRRENIIDEVKIVTVGLIQYALQIDLNTAQAMGKQLIADMNQEIQSYIKGEEDSLINLITAISDHGFLDTAVPNAGGMTIRMYIIDAITIDYSKVYSLSDISPFSFFN